MNTITLQLAFFEVFMDCHIELWIPGFFTPTQPEQSVLEGRLEERKEKQKTKNCGAEEAEKQWRIAFLLLIMISQEGKAGAGISLLPDTCRTAML